MNNFGNHLGALDNINKNPGNFFSFNTGRVKGKRNAVSNTRSSSRGSARNGMNLVNNMLHTENAP
jgi:hypothetical protein